MSIIRSQIDTQSAEYQQNRAAWEPLLDELRERLAKVHEGGGEKYVKRHRERGKLLARERVELLLDPGTPFLELSPLAAWGMYNDESPGGSQITGIGIVSGVECMIGANDPTVKGGTSYPKIGRAHV